MCVQVAIFFFAGPHFFEYVALRFLPLLPTSTFHNSRGSSAGLCVGTSAPAPDGPCVGTSAPAPDGLCVGMLATLLVEAETLTTYYKENKNPGSLFIHSTGDTN